MSWLFIQVDAAWLIVAMCGGWVLGLIVMLIWSRRS